MTKNNSIEEYIEDIYKEQLKSYGIKYFLKTETINTSIENALNNAPSKSGGTGKNYPDIKLLINKGTRYIPIVIEAKGKKDKLIKFKKETNEIELITYYDKDSKENSKNQYKKGDPNYTTIKDYAVNGAIHYANAIINGSEYNECIAIGINGYKESDESIIKELAVYYISKNNLMVPKKIDNYKDLSFLKKDNIEMLLNKLDKLNLTNEEIENETKKIEEKLDKSLKNINQIMNDDLKIEVSFRVNLICGMIIAGLETKNGTTLEVNDLKGRDDDQHDGKKFIDQITTYLKDKNLSEEKRNLIINILNVSFIHSNYWKPINGESKLKILYTMISKEILPLFKTEYHLDFTGKLFNVLNEWVSVPDGEKNDVVLTPRYVTNLMSKLAEVNQDSYVWDYCTGSAGFLVSSMKLMIEDAKQKIKDANKLKLKELKIKGEQLLGIEKLPDIYMLAVLNMLIMGDGTSNILHKNSLTEYDGLYEQGNLKGEPFPANVFLLNPPYSADGKGFIFVEKALSRMKNGKAVILIQESAGSGKGLPYTKRILENNTLEASIHMSNIFCGKAGVQTAIYVFNVGIKHDPKKKVKFIDFSNDGYTRQSRKKSSINVNLKDTDHAIERYEEIIDLVKYGLSEDLKYFSKDNYIEDKITLEGNDWNFLQHKKIDTIPTKKDFKHTVSNYLSWKINQIIKEED